MEDERDDKELNEEELEKTSGGSFNAYAYHRLKERIKFDPKISRDSEEPKK